MHVCIQYVQYTFIKDTLCLEIEFNEIVNVLIMISIWFVFVIHIYMKNVVQNYGARSNCTNVTYIHYMDY